MVVLEQKRAKNQSKEPVGWTTSDPDDFNWRRGGDRRPPTEVHKTENVLGETLPCDNESGAETGLPEFFREAVSIRRGKYAFEVCRHFLNGTGYVVNHASGCQMSKQGSVWFGVVLR